MEKFNSVHEAYTHLLIANQEIEKKVKDMDRHISFFLMNIEKDNFNIKGNPHIRKNAVQEFEYLVNSSDRLAKDVEHVKNLGTTLLNQLKGSEI